MKNSNKGFTLIELLVVIAIIGILSAVVLASLSTARSKAKDAKVQGQLSQMRAAAEIGYGALNNKYGTSGSAVVACTNVATNIFGETTSGMVSLIAAVQNDAGSANVDCGVSATGDAWSVAAKTSAGYFCVDSTGTAKSTQSSGTTAYTALTGASTAAHTAVGSSVCN